MAMKNIVFEFKAKEHFTPSNSFDNVVYVTTSAAPVPAAFETAFGAEAAAKFIEANKGSRFSHFTYLQSSDNNAQKVTIVNGGDMSKFAHDDWVKFGGAVMKAVEKDAKVAMVFDFPAANGHNSAVEDFITGFNLRSYRYTQYFSQTTKKSKANAQEAKTESVTFYVADEQMAQKMQGCVNCAVAVAQAVVSARDVVNAPGNVLTPTGFVEKINELTQMGVEVTIIDDKQMSEMGMHAIVGVSRGSVNKAKMAIMHWPGQDRNAAPVAFVGKGVTFDSGGISIKPSANMEDMKGDMGGAAAVFGAMHIFAKRQSKARVIGVVGLAENMPGGNAQKPGDIVTSYSKQTIEINNTDAEGRLVLADAISYTIAQYKPKVVVDLATLTGAMVIALGHEYAGMFSNDDMVAKQLEEAGCVSGEKLWRLPLSEAYDQLIESKFADMKNSAGREAGSISAAQFLQRFVKDTPWAHIDIAGTAFGKKPNEYTQSWGTGFGVRLLNQFVKAYYE